MKKTLEERIEQAHKKLIVPMEKLTEADRYRLIDHQLVHDIALTAINTENLLKPTLRTLQKHYKRGTYNSTLALLAWHHVAKAATVQYKTLSKLNRYEYIAIAQDITEQIEDAEWHKELWT